ncbi:MAG TPA: cohesin domain-containing protein [Anaerolineaceae bacterium]|nr:cohesin domain-containing protein [Anaerolineaceae bacterium]HUM49611.1 cohesin domain-containing protein [Anaerolineaceae bacterium]
MKQGFALKRWIGLLFVVVMALVLGSPVQAQANPQVGVFQAYEIQPAARIEIPIEIRNVQDLYAVDLELHYDPTILTIEDADPQTNGIQPALGTFLDAGMVLYNTVDAQNGIIRFVMTQVNPSEPKSGSGVLIVLYAVGKAEGESPLDVVRADLSTREGVAIPSELVGNTVTVSAAAPQSNATPIPVQNPTSIIVIPTLAPTATSTVTPVPTSTKPAPTQTAVFTAVVGAVAFPTVAPASAEQASGFSLAQNWWILLIVAAAIIGVIIYLQTGKKSSQSENKEEEK